MILPKYSRPKTRKQFRDLPTEVEKVIRKHKLLDKEELWKTKFINHDKPFVERAYMDLGEVRIYLHISYNPDTGKVETEATDSESQKSVLFKHFHPWSSVVKTYDGYDHYSALYQGSVQDVLDAISSGKDAVQKLSDQITDLQHDVLGPGDVYVFVDPRWVHYISPKHRSRSFMATTRPFVSNSGNKMSRNDANTIGPLPSETLIKNLNEFKQFIY